MAGLSKTCVHETASEHSAFGCCLLNAAGARRLLGLCGRHRRLWWAGWAMFAGAHGAADKAAYCHLPAVLHIGCWFSLPLAVRCVRVHCAIVNTFWKEQRGAAASACRGTLRPQKFWWYPPPLRTCAHLPVVHLKVTGFDFEQNRGLTGSNFHNACKQIGA